MTVAKAAYRPTSIAFVYVEESLAHFGFAERNLSHVCASSTARNDVMTEVSLGFRLPHSMAPQAYAKPL
jgi:hypothetical protein